MKCQDLIVLLLVTPFVAISLLATSHDSAMYWVKTSNIPYGFFDDRNISFIHIAKCSGRSFEREIVPAKSGQNCYKLGKSSSMMNVVFLRSPRAHVYSQFMQCKHDRFGRRVTKKTAFPRSKDDIYDLRIWLDHFIQIMDKEPRQFGPENDFNCMDPRNMQTRYMSCDWTRSEAHPDHAHQDDDDIDEAIRNVRKATFIGLTDFYHESICMLQFRSTKILPLTCQCTDLGGNATENQSDGHVHYTHSQDGVPKHSVHNLPMDVLKLEDRLTNWDQRLFLFALDRFLRDIRIAEKVAGHKFFCHPQTTEAQALVTTYNEASMMNSDQ